MLVKKEIEFDYSEIKGRMRAKNITVNELAKMMGISSVSVSCKLNNKVDFTATELYKLTKILELKNLENYFFVAKS